MANDDNTIMKQFNTFAANSPALSDYYSPKHGSQRFAFASSSSNDLSRTSALDPLRFITAPQHYNKAYKPDKRVLAQQEEEGRQSEGMESKVSLLMSQVSVPAAPALEIEAPRLFALENNITQQILELREQKITLMQELSRILDTKNLFQHYMLKASREKEELETEQGSFKDSPHSAQSRPKSPQSPNSQQAYVPLHVSAPILKRNEQLHLRLKELQIKEEIFGLSFQQSEQDHAKNQRLLEEIIHIRQMNGSLRDEIASKMKKTEVKESRFVTFLPQDRQKHFDSKASLQEYQELQEKYKKLQGLAREQTIRLTPEESQYLQELKTENRALIEQAEEMLRHRVSGNSQVASLQRKLEENQREKEVFLQQLERFKQTMKKVKQDNERLKAQLAH